jgi:RNA-directed DNA polymerase
MSAAATPAGAAPGAALTTWHAIPWRAVWRNVRRLQARIVKATQAGRWGKVKALVYLLTHSFSGRAVAVLRVTTNQGAQTPGVDGAVWDTPGLKTAAWQRLRSHGYHAQPLRRVYIPKSSDPTKVRPLGIPTLTDRAMQALYLLGLDPILETTADAHSYGFRRERSCADALEQVHIVLGHPQSAAWVLEGDIKSCFDRISHRWLEANVPMDRRLLRQWLKAGFLEKHTWFATTEGTPPGGIASPALANRTLDGLERLLATRFAATPAQRRTHKVHLVRYADDFIITGTSKELLRDEVQPLVAHFLKERGLELSHEKTSITRVTRGFDFLGQHVRRYRDGKVLLKPSRRNVRALLVKVRKVIQEEGGGLTAGQLIERLNPILRDWARYHRHASSKRVLSKVDRMLFRWLWRWARHRHDRKTAAWVKAKYCPRVGGRDWVFTGELPSQEGPPHTVPRYAAASTRIRGHVKIQGAANPYDPAWEPYFGERRTFQMQDTLTGQGITRSLWPEQDGNCLVGGQPLTPETGWQHHHVQRRVSGGGATLDNLVLLHPNCHRQAHSRGLVVAKAASREGRS